jgi:hypothetical protein
LRKEVERLKGGEGHGLVAVLEERHQTRKAAVVSDYEGAVLSNSRQGAKLCHYCKGHIDGTAEEEAKEKEEEEGDAMRWVREERREAKRRGRGGWWLVVGWDLAGALAVNRYTCIMAGNAFAMPL